MNKFKPNPLFDERKAAEVAAFFLLKASQRNASMTLLKLMKLMYLAERESYKLFGEPMIGDKLVSMPHGPVLSATLTLINTAPEERDDGAVWDDLISAPEGRYMQIKPDTGVSSTDDLRRLSRADVSILEQVWSQFGSFSAIALRDYTHDPKNCPEWVDPAGSSVPIKPETLLSSLGFSDDEIDGVARNQEQRIWVAQQLSSLCS